MELLAGLGLFFAGVKMVGSSLKQMTSRRFRKLVSLWAANSFVASLLGIAIILVTQSTSAVTFIIVSLISSGLLTVRKALPMIIWANGGCAILVLIVMLDINPVILLVLGAAGVCLYLEKPEKYHSAVSALFGLGLLFYGLNFIKAGAAPIAEMDWLFTYLHDSRHAYIFSFVLGAFLSFIVQSSAAVSVVAIAMTQAGMFTVNETMLIIYGTNLGSSLTVWLLSASLKGTTRQLAMAQVFFNIAGCFLFLILFLAEIVFQIPLVKHFVLSISSQIEQQMAYVYFLFNFCTAVILSFAITPLSGLLARFWPPTAQEDRSKLKYLHERAIEDPETAMDLVSKEQLRMLSLAEELMPELRNRTASTIAPVHQSFVALSGEVGSFLTDLADKDMGSRTSEHLLNLLNRQDLLVSIEENIYLLTKNLQEAIQSSALAPLADNLLEGLDTILLTSIGAMESGGSDLQILTTITGDRSRMMEEVRHQYLNNEERLDAKEKSALLYITNLFERIVWLSGRLAASLEKAQ